MACNPKGRWIYLWDANGDMGPLEPARCADDIVSMGFDGVMIHQIETGPGWITPGRVSAFNTKCLKVAASLGSYGPTYVSQIIALGTQYMQACMRADHPIQFLNWDLEGSWNGHKKEAQQLVDGILTTPNAVDHCVDAPWWDPLTTMSGNPSWPNYPTATFGVMAAGSRFVQAYGAPVLNRTLEFLQWARNPSQYPKLGNWTINAAVQAYHRSVADHVTILRSEPDHMVWNLVEMDVSCRVAYQCWHALEQAGFSGMSAISDYQKAHGLKADGILGPNTCASLDVQAPSGVVWYGNGA